MPEVFSTAFQRMPRHPGQAVLDRSFYLFKMKGWWKILTTVRKKKHPLSQAVLFL
jgi:hypothetical protein